MTHTASKKIQFHYLYGPFYFKERNHVKHFIEWMIKKEKKKIAVINFIFCSDEYLLVVNRNHLNHDYYTDIITFNVAANHQPFIADIYISIERIKENAQVFHSSFTQELLRVIFHGILHLCGYKDKTKIQAQEIRLRENYYLEQFSVSRGKTHL